MFVRRILSFIYFIHEEEATPQVDMKIMKVLTEVKNSIGMFHGKLQGSCWRAGTDLIVTAWHVVKYHICKLVKL